MNNDSKDLALGIDIGTSSIKLVILNIFSDQIIYEDKISTFSVKLETDNSKFDEQDVKAIIQFLKNGFERIPEKLYPRIKGVQLCGQVNTLI